MEHEYRIIKNAKAIDVPAPADRARHEPGSKLDQAIDDIQSRANHVGPVLEGIIQAHPCDPKPGKLSFPR
jgi:hypothetical protein